VIYFKQMRILKTKKFSNLAEDEGLTDETLRTAISEFENGLTGAALGGNLYKKRVAIGSKGKSGGLRTILVYKQADDKVFCIHLFAKQDEENISQKALESFKLMADFMLSLDAKQISKSIEEKVLIEVS